MADTSVTKIEIRVGADILEVDPAKAQDDDALRALVTLTHPELAGAQINRAFNAGVQTITFEKRMGTKG
jgi:hypothetical protein